MDFIKYGYENMGDSPWKMVLIILFLAIGLVMIIKGGDFFVDAASWIAEKTGIPKLIIGATIVSLATTLPELLVSVFAAVEGVQTGASSAVDMATGNALGSVIANTGLIMSISILFMPVEVERKTFIVKPLILIASITLLFIFSIDRNLYVWEAIILLVVLVLFFADNVYEAIREGKKKASLESAETEVELEKVEVSSEEKVNSNKKEIIVNTAKFVIGIAGIVFGAQFLVDNGTALATELGVPEKIIAITIVAIGTSLPELITTITAIIKKQSDLSVGNVIGANIIDITMILSICAIVYGKSLPVFTTTLCYDLPFALGLAIVGTVPTMFTKKLQRWQGFAMLAIYITYLTLNIVLPLA